MYLPLIKELVCPHYVVSGREGGMMGRAEGGWQGGTSRGVSWMCCWMVGWLACTVVLVMLVVGDPICAGVGTFPSSCLMGVLYTYEHSLLDGPRLAVDLLMYYAELVGVHGMACGGAM